MKGVFLFEVLPRVFAVPLDAVLGLEPIEELI